MTKGKSSRQRKRTSEGIVPGRTRPGRVSDERGSREEVMKRVCTMKPGRLEGESGGFLKRKRVFSSKSMTDR